MTDIYGAIIVKDGKIVNPETDETLIYHPDYIYDETGAPIDVDDFHGWIGDGDVYGSWIGFYRTQIWLIHNCNLIRRVDIHDDCIVTEDKPFAVMDSLPDMDFIYLSSNDPSRYRYYLRTAIGKFKEREYRCYFGLGLTNEIDTWEKNKENKTFGFSRYEIRQFDALFDSQTRQGS